MIPDTLPALAALSASLDRRMADLNPAHAAKRDARLRRDAADIAALHPSPVDAAHVAAGNAADYLADFETAEARGDWHGAAHAVKHADWWGAVAELLLTGRSAP